MPSLPLIVILGPTATGKSNLGIELAQYFQGEIISADSRQVYQYFNIGSGTVSKPEQNQIPHHLINIVPPWQSFTLNNYLEKARPLISSLQQKYTPPFLVGGTGLYIRAITEGFVLPNQNVTQKNDLSLNQLQQEIIKQHLTHHLNQSDWNNPIRLQAFLNRHNQPKNSPPSYPIQKIGLFYPRDMLRQMIQARVHYRLQQGAIEEIQTLQNILQDHLSTSKIRKKLDSFGLGTTIIRYYLEGFLTYNQMVDKYITAEYQYAKRQMTWFRKDSHVVWFDMSLYTKESLISASTDLIQPLLQER